MRGAGWIPGVSAARAGYRGLAGILLVAWTAGLALLGWRHELVLEALAPRGPAPDPDVPLGALRVATAALLLLVLGLPVACGLAARGTRGSRDPEAAHPARRLLRRLARHPEALSGFGILLALHLAALLCPLLTTVDPARLFDIVEDDLLSPSLAHPLGTDANARDVLSRLLWGARASLLVGSLSVAIAVVIGTAWGACAGYLGGRGDALLMRVVDFFLCFPTILLLICVLGVLPGRSLAVIVLVIGLTSWMGVARLVRGQFLSLKEREFVEAARALGAGPARIVLRHLLPNSLTPVVIAATLRVGNVILLEAGLSYLGLGVERPHPTWGNIVRENAGALFDAWWVPGSAGLAIVVTVVGYNLLGDGLRDVLDPRHGR